MKLKNRLLQAATALHAQPVYFMQDVAVRRYPHDDPIGVGNNGRARSRCRNRGGFAGGLGDQGLRAARWRGTASQDSA